MKRVASLKMITVMVLGALPGVASAAEFQLIKHSAGLGNIFTASAVATDDASTIYYNPAGMTQLRDREILAGISVMNPSFNLPKLGSIFGSSSESKSPEGKGGDVDNLTFIPHFYTSWTLTKDINAGIGINSSFSLESECKEPEEIKLSTTQPTKASDSKKDKQSENKDKQTESDDFQFGVAQSRSFKIKTINVNPSLAWRVNENLSLGAGMSWQHMEGVFNPTNPALSMVTPEKSGQLKLNNGAWGWNVGAICTLSPSTKAGLSYRSAIKHELEGKANSNGVKSNNDIKTTMKSPEMVILSVSQQLSDRWEMLGDLSWMGWSSIPKVDIMNTATGSSIPKQNLLPNLRNTWRAGLGANYKCNDALKIKYGIDYNQTPIQGAESTTWTSLSENDRLSFLLGAQWTPSKMSRIDLGVNYVYAQDSKAKNDKKKTSDNTWGLGVKYSLAF